jgi:predicted ATP-grasp superfamily ATP-dependent carboligase
MNALVMDGNQRPALAIVRSLGRRGISVIVGDEGPTALASSSRYCVRHVTYPSPYKEVGAFERFLMDFLARERIDVVVPVTDVTTHAVARNQDAIHRFSATAVPPVEAFDLMTDKWQLIRRASACDIRVPRTIFVEHGGKLPSVLAEVEYPAVVKPARSRIATSTGWLLATVDYAQTPADLRQLYRERAHLASYPSLIQERIVGPGTGLFVLCDRGSVRAGFAHRRIRERPPTGGASVLSESIAVDKELMSQAKRLLEPTGWHGVAMLEYKEDRRTGLPFLMEVNGRFWGSLQLAIDAGVDFPYLAYQLALGRAFSAPPSFAVGVRSRWLLGDLDHLLIRLFRGSRSQNLPDGAPSKFRTVLDFLKVSGDGMRYDVMSRTDGAPALYEARQYARGMCSIASAAAHKLLTRSTRRQATAPPAADRFEPARPDKDERMVGTR